MDIWLHTREKQPIYKKEEIRNLGFFFIITSEEIGASEHWIYRVEII